MKNQKLRKDNANNIPSFVLKASKIRMMKNRRELLFLKYSVIDTFLVFQQQFKTTILTNVCITIDVRNPLETISWRTPKVPCTFSKLLYYKRSSRTKRIPVTHSTQRRCKIELITQGTNR